MARRRSGRHARRLRRITPRRWLPFVALVAVIAGAVVVSRQASDPEPPSTSVEVPSARLPVASEPGALSTAWYCSGGTAQGDEGPAELSVVIANVDGAGASAEVVVQGSNGERRRSTVRVPANGRTRVVGADILESEWIAMTVEVFGGRAAVEREVTGPHGVDVSPCSTNASARWYVPSGSRVRGASGQLLLYNPFPDATSVDISFATDEGKRAPRVVQGLSIPGRSLRLVPESALSAQPAQVATRIVARTGRIVVDRVQIYDGTGDPVAGSGEGAVETPAPEGLASTAAIPAASARWLFPQAVLRNGARTQVGIYNPSGRAAEVDVVVTYEDPTRNPEVEPIGLTVRSGEQRVVDLTDVGTIDPDVPFTIDVRSLDGVAVVAEQLVFGAVDPTPDPPADEVGGDGQAPEGEGEATEQSPEEEAAAGEAKPVVPGFAVVPGSPVAADTWVLPSMGSSTGRTVEVVVANPGTESVTVRVASYEAGERIALDGATVEVPPGDRRVLDLSEAVGNPALAVRADGDVVVGHASVVVGTKGIVWALATPFPDTVVTLPPGR